VDGRDILGVRAGRGGGLHEHVKDTNTPPAGVNRQFIDGAARSEPILWSGVQQ
jgi:hypothetical protein